MKVEVVMTKEQWEKEFKENRRCNIKGILAIAIGSVVFYLAMASIAAALKAICNMDLLYSAFNLL